MSRARCVVRGRTRSNRGEGPPITQAHVEFLQGIAGRMEHEILTPESARDPGDNNVIEVLPGVLERLFKALAIREEDTGAMPEDDRLATVLQGGYPAQTG